MLASKQIFCKVFYVNIIYLRFIFSVPSAFCYLDNGFLLLTEHLLLGEQIHCQSCGGGDGLKCQQRSAWGKKEGAQGENKVTHPHLGEESWKKKEELTLEIHFSNRLKFSMGEKQ